jgi:L-lactate dehydrogenase complex protein LldG
MSHREEILGRTRAALSRKAGDSVPAPPRVRLHRDSVPQTELVSRFKTALELLAGKVSVVRTMDDARACVESALAGRRAISSGAAILQSLGLTVDTSRDACATADAGITSADFALADTGSLVFLTESRESRLITLLPPCHIAVIPRSAIVASLDDVFALRPLPTAGSSAMTVITGPSRTADIEMRLVRGVHGPGEIHVIVVDIETPIP